MGSGEGMELWLRGVVGRGEDEEERRNVRMVPLLFVQKAY